MAGAGGGEKKNMGEGGKEFFFGVFFFFFPNTPLPVVGEGKTHPLGLMGGLTPGNRQKQNKNF